MPENDLDFDDDDLDPQPGETESDLVRRLRSTIKGKNNKLKEQTKELDELRPLRETVANIEFAKSLDKAFTTEELDTLNDRQRSTLVREVGDDKSPEGLRKAAEELGWVEARTSELEQELAGHERVEGAGRGAGAAAGSKIDAAVVAGWPMDKQLRFKSQHGDAWESIKRGDAVTGITF